ncbi:xanthotoxin 5-hydroxylase CYP82C4-like [Tripterygium wilfordii]|uniref:xanthotoxin 5-hydroxylase CYP82C4-like n=1 Tax=Tripterygium wilfordii TaxID=458696 RepID=UPI0018F809E6|nr:xanthotoxin 5-hydroxylase CYP82C4-like [Tripterygium wilfordii]
MDFALPLPTNVIVAITLACTLLVYYFFTKPKHPQNNKKSPPEAKGALPFIGHLHLLARSSKSAYKILGEMADKIGPTFILKLGVHRTLIVSTPEIAKECFTTNDRIFATRPTSMAADILGYHYAMFAISPYGPYWREMRKIATVELLSNHRIDLLREVLKSEVRTPINKIRKQMNTNETAVKMDLKQWLEDLNLNMITRVIAGKQCVGAKTKAEKEEYERIQKGLKELLALAGSFAVGDALPFLRRFDIGGVEKAMRRTSKEMDGILQEWLNEHKQKRASGKVEGTQDFIDVMLSICDRDAVKSSSHDADTIIKATCLSLVLGGAETSTMALTWAISLLLNNPPELKKAQQELDTCVGRDRRIEDSDLQKLVYIPAIIKETLRIYPPSALDAPHMSTEDCTIDGFHIPAGTQLLVNIAKVNHDPRAWPNPEEFKPERFLTTHKHIDFRGQDFELLPFGSGRRVCPGIPLANQSILLTLSNLLHEFDIASPTGGPVDMTEGLGFTLFRANPLEVLLTPRLPAHLYA